MASENQEELLELNKYLGKFCINQVVQWYIQHLFFNKPNRNSNGLPVFLLILFKFSLSAVQCLPFLLFALCLQFLINNSFIIVLWLCRKMFLFFRDDAEAFRGKMSRGICNLLSNGSKNINAFPQHIYTKLHIEK